MLIARQGEGEVTNPLYSWDTGNESRREGAKTNVWQLTL